MPDGIHLGALGAGLPTHCLLAVEGMDRAGDADRRPILVAQRRKAIAAVFERGCETSYDLALGFAKDCAQRCQVAEPSVLAIPSSSPAPHREGPVCAWAAETSAPAAANAHTNREVNIFRLPIFVAHGARTSRTARAHTVIKCKRHDGARRRRRQGPAGISALPARARPIFWVRGIRTRSPRPAGAPRYQPASPPSYPRRFGNQVAIAGNAMMISRSTMLIAM
jgi:hypothetical protein